MRRSRRRRPTSHRRRPRRSLKSSRNITKFRPGYHRTAGLWKTARQRASEIKFHDTSNDVAAFIDTIPNTSLITGIPEGNGRSARIGQKINVIGLELAFEFDHRPADGDNGNANAVRLQIWLDKQANGTQAVDPDYLQLTGHSAPHMKHPNKSNEDRFVLLGEKNLTFGTPGGMGSTPARWARSIKNIKWNLKLPKLPIHYSSTTGSITEVRSNNIFISYQPHFVGLTLMTFNYRTHYIDKN